MITIFAFVIAFYAVWFFIMRNASDMSKLSNEQLQEENEWDMAFGYYPNMYSKEIERRSANRG